MTDGRPFIGLAGVLALLGPAALALSEPARSPAGPLLVIAGPQTEQVIAAAGGRLVGPRQPRFGRLSQGADPEFAQRLRRAGAWLVISDPRLLAICGVTP